jgi:hypothetical protein
MPGLRSYSTTPAANTALFPEGMAPSAVNDGMRQVQADIRAWYEDPGWIDFGHTPTYASTTTFTVSGDRTAIYHAGRRVRATGTAPFTLFGSVSGSIFASETTVTVVWDAGSLDNTLIRVEAGAASAIAPATPQASATVRGIVELADAAEVSTGTDAQRVPTPATLAAAVAFQGRQTIWIPANAMIPRLTAGAVQGTSETTTHKLIRRTLDFAPAAPRYAQFVVAMPKSWDEGSVTAEFLWTAASGAGAVVWGLQAVALSDGDAMDAAFGTAQETTDTLLAAGDLHRAPETAAVTLGGAPAEGDLAAFQVYRDATNGADTLTTDAQLIGVRLFYTTDAKNDA